MLVMSYAPPGPPAHVIVGCTLCLRRLTPKAGVARLLPSLASIWAKEMEGTRRQVALDPFSLLVPSG